jgi:non-specific protein-tyrosine kinase
MQVEATHSFSNDIRQYARVLWHWAWLVALMTVLAGSFTYIFSLRQPKIYRASATLLIDQPQISTDYASILTDERIAQTYSQMMIQPSTLEGVIQQLSLDQSVADLEKALQVQVIPETRLLEITITDIDPQRAAQIANTTVAVFDSRIGEFQASRYQETKDSLEAQMASMDQQIQETTLVLERVLDPSETGSQKDILQVQLEAYRNIYQGILTQLVALETQTPLDGNDTVEENPPTVEDQLESIATKITEISTEIEAMGIFARGAQYELLKTQLAAYQDLYQRLIRDLVLSENGLASESDSSAPSVKEQSETLNGQLEIAAQRIQELTAEINSLGGSTDGGVERDRLESNLALYRQTYANLVQSYEQVRLAEIQNTSRVDLVQPAIPPTHPVQPNIVQNTFLGVVLGLFIGVGIVFLIETMDDSVKGPEEITKLGLGVLGYIGHMERVDECPITAERPRSHLAEAYRSLRTNIQYASLDHPLAAIMVTSPTPKDGKSTVIANLGVVLAQGGHRVTIVDADLRIPDQHNIFKFPNTYGLTDALIHPDIQVVGNIRKTQVPNLTVLTSGEIPHNPAELMASNRMLDVIRQVAETKDVLLIDTPPVMAVTDPVVLATRMDGVIIVVRPGKTQMGALINTTEQLHQVGANILGVVLNDVENVGKRYAVSYNGYYYGKYDEYVANPEGNKPARLKQFFRNED